MVLSRILLIAVLLLLPTTVLDSYGHGLVSVKDCNKANLPFNQELYREDILGINQAARYYIEGNPEYKMSDLAAYMVNVYLNQPVELAHCLRDLGINPASVAQLSPLAYDALIYDKKNLQGYSHDFLADIPAPQAGIQNILSGQHHMTDQQKNKVEVQSNPSSLVIVPAQAVEAPVQNFGSSPTKLQIPLESIFISIAIAAIVGMIIVFFTMKTEKDIRFPVIPQRKI